MKYKLIELIDIERLQSLMDKFLLATGTATGILDPEGNIITASGWQPICTKYHRMHPETQKNCRESDTALANSLKAGNKFNLYRCLNGLIDVAMPIYVKNVHIANLFIGQFLDKEPDLDFFRVQAEKYDFPVDEYMHALSKVQVLNEDEVKKKLAFLSELAVLIAELAWQKQSTLELQEDLENRVKERTKALRDAQIATLNIMQDVESERLKTEALNRDLTNTNKELEMFAYVASHDLQEPLRKVYSFTELLEKRYSSLFDEKAYKYMSYITSGTQRMQQLITDLLTFSRLSTRETPFRSFAMMDIVTEILDEYSLVVEEKNAHVQLSELPEVNADKLQMKQLWSNLIGNALKFTGDREPEIKISAESKGSFWLFSIADNGIGIEKEYAQKVFVIFQRLHARDEYSGTGIGLALCKKIVERHNGKIWFESEPGKGSTFYFTLAKELKTGIM